MIFDAAAEILGVPGKEGSYSLVYRGEEIFRVDKKNSMTFSFDFSVFSESVSVIQEIYVLQSRVGYPKPLGKFLVHAKMRG